MNTLKKIVYCCILLTLFSCNNKNNTANKSDKENEDKNLVELPLELADPAIFLHEGTYYLYGTGGDSNYGFLVYTSTDLKTWEGPQGASNGYALTKNDAYGTAGFWAPHIFEHKGKIYMAYTANEDLAIASSDSPLGPFKQETQKKLSGAENQIDPFVFFDEDGKIYLYHVRHDNGNKLYIAEMEDDLSDIKPETAKLCLEALPNTWEDTQNVQWKVAEGPTVLKHNNRYYLFYSANDFRNIDYAVGYAISDSPTGPWERHPQNPIISRNTIEINGTGHGDFFKDKNGNWQYVFHVHASQEKVGPRKTGIISGQFTNDPSGIDKMELDNTTFSYLTQQAYIQPTDDSNNPLSVAFGDPFVIHASDGQYYMYGTSENLNGFKAYSSNNLIDWKEEGQVYEGATPESWALDCFWAPEVYERNGKYYIWYSANWKHNPTNEGENFRIGVAVSDSPKGPFKEMHDKPIFDPGYPIIDANLHFDDENNKVYLYYSRCCYKNPVESEVATWAKEKGWFDEIEESWVYGVELQPDFSDIIGEPQLLLRPPVTINDQQAEWESRSVTSREVNRRWTEGSFIFKKEDTYYMMYSANYFGGKNYAVGYATSKHPLGPFDKAKNNPILQKNIDQGGEVTGTGHNMVLTLPNGEIRCVYHGRTQKTGDQRVVFIDKMEIDKQGILRVNGPTTK